MSSIPLQPTQPMTLEVAADELVVLKHMRQELHNSQYCRMCRQDNWWYERCNSLAAEQYQKGQRDAISKVAEG